MAEIPPSDVRLFGGAVAAGLSASGGRGLPAAEPVGPAEAAARAGLATTIAARARGDITAPAPPFDRGGALRGEARGEAAEAFDRLDVMTPRRVVPADDLRAPFAPTDGK